MNKLTVAAVAALTLASTPAFAQGTGDFSGPKIAAIAGYDHVDYGIVAGGADEADGLLFGAALGYDLQSGGLVYGVELELTESTGELSGGGLSVETGRDIYAGGRLGFVVGSNVLLYGKAGYTNARASSPGAGGANADGFRGGAGLEANFGQNFFGRVEYRYSNYEAGVERHQGVAALGVRF